jgi:hypothetical protein
MTILSVAKDVCRVVGLDEPDVLFSSADRDSVELRSAIQEMATRIVKEHDWRILSTESTITGDGSTVDFDLPTDYARMPKDAQLWSSQYQAPLDAIQSLNDWLGLETLSFQMIISAWIIYGGQIHVKPALSTGTTVKYFYQSDKAVSPASGSNKATFTADDDVFRLDERLLKLATIWRWKEYKGQPYGESMADFEEALSIAIGNDKGARIIVTGTRRVPGNVQTAYPGVLG